jgi:hypothetical protein
MKQQTEIEQKTPVMPTTLRKEWTDYDLRSLNLLNPDGSKTGKQVIYYNDKFVNVASESYYILPNEKVIEIGNKIASELENAKRFNPKKPRSMHWAKVRDGVISNTTGTRVQVNYMLGESVDITGNGDEVSTGFSIGNSIDLSRGLSIQPFSYRPFCDNVAFHWVGEQSLERVGQLHAKKQYEVNSPAISKQFLKAKKKLAEFEELPKLKFRHTKAIDPTRDDTYDVIRAAIKGIQYHADRVTQAFKKMVDLKIKQHHVTQLYETVPTYLLKEVDWVDINHKEGTAKLASNTSQWLAYNDLTALLTRGERNYASTMRNYHKIDDVLVRPLEVTA